MKKLFILATMLAVLPVMSMPASASPAESAQSQCAKAAKKGHVSKDKLDAYIKTCVEKHEAKKDAVAPMPAK